MARRSPVQRRAQSYGLATLSGAIAGDPEVGNGIESMAGPFAQGIHAVSPRRIGVRDYSRHPRTKRIEETLACEPIAFLVLRFHWPLCS